MLQAQVPVVRHLALTSQISDQRFVVCLKWVGYRAENWQLDER